MLPSDFQQKYPAVARALHSMFSETAVAPREESEQAARKSELRQIVKGGECLDEVFRTIWIDVQQSQSRFFETSVAAYHHLGVSDDVRDFMGRLWCSGLRTWPVSIQQEFLRRVIEQKGFYLFEALDFAAPIFQHIEFRSEFMLEWMTDARRAVGNDLYQRGLLACLKNYACFQSRATITLIRMATAQRHDPQVRGALARMLHLARGAVRSEDSAELTDVEAGLRALGDAASRALLLESWALSAGSAALSEERALALHDELCRGANEEQSTWCFLLAQVVGADKASWPWAHRELAKLATATLDTQGRYWALISGVNGWAAADDTDASRKKWADLFFLPPAEHDGRGCLATLGVRPAR